MLGAGSETSATTLDWAMAEMLKNPRILEKAQDEVRRLFDDKLGYVDESYIHEIEYLKAIIKETLRLHAEMRDRRIRSPGRYQNHGRRICPGISFGLANVELPLAMFLYHFDWSLADGMKHEELDMTERSGITARRHDDLLVIPVIKRPLSPPHVT
ncbi:hypothetical protein ABFS83_13G159000 [Erythranthe nasuta]